jgi:hypothetical protein
MGSHMPICVYIGKVKEHLALCICASILSHNGMASIKFFDMLKFIFNHFSRAVILRVGYEIQVREYYHQRILH